MIALLNWRVYAALALVAVLAFTHIEAYKSGKKHITAQWDAAKVVQETAAKEAEIENRKIESARQLTVIAAQTAATVRVAALRADAARAAAQSDSLRHTIATLTTALPSRSPAAVSQYASTAGQLLGECSAAYTDMAATSDGHASDALMLQQAWPH
jgi:hypothetical protein